MSSCADAFIAYRKHKQATGEDILQYLSDHPWAAGALAGAGTGAITGSLSDRKGSMLKHVLGGAAIGGGLGGAYELGRNYLSQPQQQPQQPKQIQDSPESWLAGRKDLNDQPVAGANKDAPEDWLAGRKDLNDQPVAGAEADTPERWLAGRKNLNDQPVAGAKEDTPERWLALREDLHGNDKPDVGAFPLKGDWDKPFSVPGAPQKQISPDLPLRLADPAREERIAQILPGLRSALNRSVPGSKEHAEAARLLAHFDPTYSLPVSVPGKTTGEAAMTVPNAIADWGKGVANKATDNWNHFWTAGNVEKDMEEQARRAKELDKAVTDQTIRERNLARQKETSDAISAARELWHQK